MTRRLSLVISSGAELKRGIDFMWGVIRELDRKGPWAVPDVEGQTREDQRTVSGFVRRLVTAELAVEVGSRPVGVRNVEAKLYRLKERPAETPILRKDGARAARRGGTRQMWNAIRQLKTFTVTELSVAASTDECSVPRVTASSYVQHLRRAGYLVMIGQHASAHTGTFRLKPSMNTGPKPPMILATKVVWDQNRNHAVGAVEAHEVAP